MSNNKNEALKIKKASYEIRFDKGAWERHDEAGKIKKRKRYTKSVADSQALIEPLNGYDDFAELKIDAKVYEQREGSAYGIPRDPKIHRRDNVVLKHQLNAAQRFLHELRGFGLLADVVGSGKTYEAGIVLSELAARNLVKSMLIVVPSQVFDSWVDVLENKFGLGKNRLYQVRAPKKDAASGRTVKYPDFDDVAEKTGYTTESNGKVSILRPILVDIEVFSQWRIDDKVVFDVIVVDEAHHLCQEDGHYAHAMKLLSQLMENKKKYKASTYCLLLSATPHSGNLANMFRLWYFVRKQGGNSSDFEVKEDNRRTKGYREEKDYYREDMCRGATNVTDFIRKVKLSEVENRYRHELMQWLAKNRKGADYDSLDEFGKAPIVDAFLKAEEHESIRHSVLVGVAHAYHAVLRSIMIRQPNNLSSRYKKILQNIFFYPLPDNVYAGLSKLNLGSDWGNITLDYNSTTVDEILPTVINNGERQSMVDYIASHKGIKGEKNKYADLLGAVLATFDKAFSKQFPNVNYSRKDYVKYYLGRFRTVDEDAWSQTTILPAMQGEDYKYAYLTQLLTKHKTSRVIVFFDYELGKKESVIDSVVAKLQANPEFKSRLILSNDASEDAIISKFNKKSDAILLVMNSRLTEGANLQEGNIIINYQVTPDPLAMDQRIGRVFRLGQKSDVTIYSLADVNKLEGYALAYFVGIGLLSSNSGDATILAGSNSDQMVTIRCKRCSNVKLMSRVRFNQLKEKDSNELYCYHINTVHADDARCLMEEISVSDYKCDKCGRAIERPVEDEGYECFSDNNEATRGKLCNGGESGDRKIYCGKLCAMSHCERLKTIGCLAYKRILNGDAESHVRNACRDCNKCNNEYAKCRVNSDNGCIGCEESGCRPAPFVLHFNEKWEANCPDPRCNGKLRQVLPKTFAAYIRSLWKFPMSGDRLNYQIDSFCQNLHEEADKVDEIREVLKLDEEKFDREG